jgi:DNA-binding MarR family transcriptional regulator
MSDADATPDLPGRLGVAVQLLAHGGKQAGKDAGKAGGGRGELTPTRLTALAVMAAAGPMRLGALASRLGVQVSTMSRIVDIMVTSGWVERRPDEADHRACVIGLTSRGSALLDAVRQDTATRLAECVARLGPGDLAVLEAALPLLESLAQQVACRTSASTPEAAIRPAASLVLGPSGARARDLAVIGTRGLPGENAAQLVRGAVWVPVESRFEIPPLGRG